MTDPLPQRIVPFYSDELVAVQQPDGTIFVLFSRLCENLGLSRWTQSRRVQNHAVLSTGLVTLPVETPGGPQEVQCLRLDLLPLWLAGVPARKAGEEIKEKLILYQTEAAQVLWREFKPQILVEVPPADRESALAIGQLEQIIEQSKAMQKMAEEQIALIRRMDAAARAFKAIQTDVVVVKGDVADVKIRLGVLEERLHPSTYITDAQAAEIQSAVAAVAMALTKRDPSKNHFQSIHAELHRRFKAKSYSLIRVEQYAAVLKFLETWDAAMEGDKGDA
ncbi:MAG: phage antirepressor N-terminal domain-containing protein [Roseiflexaceae bacterium]